MCAYKEKEVFGGLFWLIM